MDSLQSTRTNTIISAQCVVIVLFFGFALCMPGAVSTGIGNTNRREFFESSKRPMRIIGPILLAIGFTLVLCGTAMCVYLRTLARRQWSGPVIMGAATGARAGVSLGPVHQQSVPLGQANQHIGNYHYNSKEDNLFSTANPGGGFSSGDIGGGFSSDTAEGFS